MRKRSQLQFVICSPVTMQLDMVMINWHIAVVIIFDAEVVVAVVVAATLVVHVVELPVAVTR